MEDGSKFKWAYGYGVPIPKEYIMEFKRIWMDENNWIGLDFIDSQEEDKNSIDLEDKSNGE